jgi:uncharacterized membrane protein
MTWRISGLVLLLHLIFAAYSWFQLPDTIPTHFDKSGAPDGWATRSIPAWFGIVAVSFALQCLPRVLLSTATRGFWNIPEKERFLELNEEQQAPIIDRVQAFAGFSAICLSVTLLALHFGMYLAAIGRTNGLSRLILIGMFFPVLVLILTLIPWSRGIKRAILNASSAGQ